MGWDFSPHAQLSPLSGLATAIAPEGLQAEFKARTGRLTDGPAYRFRGREDMSTYIFSIRVFHTTCTSVRTVHPGRTTYIHF